MKPPDEETPVLTKFCVTYTAIVYAETAEEACENMLDSDQFDTFAEEIGS